MNSEERARVIDEAYDASMEAVLGETYREVSKEDFLEVNRRITAYCEDRGLPAAEILAEEVKEASKRHRAGNLAFLDQVQAERKGGQEEA